jgi:hypothetical protein
MFARAEEMWLAMLCPKGEAMCPAHQLIFFECWRVEKLQNLNNSRIYGLFLFTGIAYAAGNTSAGNDRP